MIQILTSAQAEAINTAMCALKNVGNVSSEFNLPNDVWVQVTQFGAVNIVPRVHGAKYEAYPTQPAFAAAYGLTK
jgi:hypothetical protein